MAEFISGKSANDVWRSATELLLKQDINTNCRTGKTSELLHAFITIEDPTQKWIYDRIPPMSIGYALAELMWIMNGEERSDVINVWNPSLPKFAGKAKYYHGAYGNRMRSHFNFDQIEKAYQALQFTPESRQVVIQIYDTMIDFPIDNGKPQNDDIPCNICSMLKVRYGKLEWSQIMRSNDILFGMPYDFVQFMSIQEILSSWLNLGVGSYNHYSDSLHLYEKDEHKIGIDRCTNLKNEDKLAINKKDFDIISREIYSRMKIMALNKFTEIELSNLACLGSTYEAYNNIMFIITAYIADKSNYNDLKNDLVEKCTNMLYNSIWSKWLEQKNS